MRGLWTTNVASNGQSLEKWWRVAKGKLKVLSEFLHILGRTWMNPGLLGERSQRYLCAMPPPEIYNLTLLSEDFESCLVNLLHWELLPVAPVLLWDQEPDRSGHEQRECQRNPDVVLVGPHEGSPLGELSRNMNQSCDVSDNVGNWKVSHSSAWICYIDSSHGEVSFLIKKWKLKSHDYFRLIRVSIAIFEIDGSTKLSQPHRGVAIINVTLSELKNPSLFHHQTLEYLM